MRYSIRIMKLEKNEDYKREIKEWEEGMKYGGFSHHPEQMRPRLEKEIPALETILTEEEFKKVKKAVLEVM